MKPCPNCGVMLVRIENDMANRWQCPTIGCFFHGSLLSTEAVELMRHEGCVTCQDAGKPSRSTLCRDCKPNEWKNWRPANTAVRREIPAAEGDAKHE